VVTRPRPRHRLGVLVVAGIGLILAGWGAGELIRSYTTTLDLHAVQDLARDRTSSLTGLSRALSLIGSGYVVFPGAVLCAVVLYRLHRSRAAAVILLSTIGATVIANLDKLLVDRPRPPVHHLEVVSSASFPSGHASQSTGFYVSALIVLLLVLGPRARAVRVLAMIATVVIVIGVCFSRVYLGVHYPTDVAAGLVLVGIWTVVVASVLRPQRPRARTSQ
jgi:undecaprenyl-diphosphatase